MFPFRRRKAAAAADPAAPAAPSPATKIKPSGPKKDEDGYFYVDDGEEFDSDEFETDSDYSNDDRDDGDNVEENVGKVGDEDENKGGAKVGISSSSSGSGSGVMVEKEEETPSTTPPISIAPPSTPKEEKVKEEEEEKAILNHNGKGQRVMGSLLGPVTHTAFASTGTTTNDSTNKNDNADDNKLNTSTGQVNSAEKIQSDIEAIWGMDNADTNTNTTTSANKLVDTPTLTPPIKKDETNAVSSETEKKTSSSSSLAETRNLLALAISHDRVDVLKNILEEQAKIDEHIVQLLLNNTSGTSSTSNNENVIDAFTFIPPLHIAVASSSIQATSCLLRMGANPAIRPMIPSQWEGPGWTNENGELLTCLGLGQCPWGAYHNVTAWEIAFGSASGSTSEDDTRVEPEPEPVRGWFGMKSPSKKENANAKANVHAPRVVLRQDQLEGIRIAFASEVLRAIGSDESGRLNELLQSGFGSGRDNKGKANDNDNDNRVMIGDKDLRAWCDEMEAVKCTELLKGNVSNSTETISEEITQPKELGAGAGAGAGSGGINTKATEETVVVSTEKVTDEIISDAKEQVDPDTIQIPGTQYDLAALETLQQNIAIHTTLIEALSTSIDVMAEEVSTTHGLILQKDHPTNELLLSQVRSLKEKRGEAEDEIGYWEGRRKDAQAELKMVMIWWRKNYNAISRRGMSNITATAEQVVEERVQRAVAERMMMEERNKMMGVDSNAPAPLTSSLNELHIRQAQGNDGAGGDDDDIVNNLLSDDEIIIRINRSTALLQSMTSKVDKLRSSMARLAEERRRNINEIEDLGLMGAVTLTRKLKEEVKSRENELMMSIEMESDVRLRVAVARRMLEELNEEQEQEDVKVKEEVSKVMSAAPVSVPVVEPSPVAMETVSPIRATMQDAESKKSHINPVEVNVRSREVQLANMQESRSPTTTTTTIIATGEPDSSSEITNEASSQPQQQERDYLSVQSSSGSESSESRSYYSGSSDGSHDGDMSSSYDDAEDDDSTGSFDPVAGSAFRPHSEDITGGYSTALAKKAQEGELFTAKLWDLLLRIVGLGKTAVKKTAVATVEEVVRMPNVLIV